MLNNYIKEFVAITEFLEKNDNKKTLKYIISEKPEVIRLLDKNKYDTAQNKLKIWKALNWIDADEDHVTKKVYFKEDNKYKRCIKIYLQVYKTLKEFNVK